MKRLTATLMLLTALLLGAFPAAAQAPADKSVATVNGEALSETAFMAALLARYGERCLNALVGNLAVAQAAKAAGVEVTADELKRRYVTTERTVELRAPVSGENFEMWLAKRSLTREYFGTELYYQLLIEKMVEKETPVKVTEQDVAGFYQRYKDQMAEPAMMRLAHICLQSDKEARQIKADIVQGKIEWSEAVKKYSLDPWTKDNGGDMGFLDTSQTPLHKGATTLKANGDISDPVETRMGFHLLKRLAYREARTPPFEEIEANIRQRLEREQLTNLTTAKRNAILRAAKVEVQLKMPQEPGPPATPSPEPAPATQPTTTPQ